MKDIHFVIFDCDGVLVDSEPLTNTLMRDSLAEHGLVMPLEEVHSLFVGGTMLSAQSEARARGADLPDDWIPQLYKKMFALLAAECELIAGVVHVLDRLDSAGISYAIGSNGPMDKMRVTLGRNDLWDRFAGRVYTAHDCEASKPAPDVYLKAAKIAGIAPENCAVIEDSVSGVKAGNAAGMQVFGYTADTAAEKLAPFCVQVFDDMRDLPRIFDITT